MSEENKGLVRRFFDEVLNAHNPEAAANFCAPDIVDHNPFPEQPPGLEGTKHALVQLVTAFPDLRCSIDSIVSEGDLVVAQQRSCARFGHCLAGGAVQRAARKC